MFICYSNFLNTSFLVCSVRIIGESDLTNDFLSPGDMDDVSYCYFSYVYIYMCVVILIFVLFKSTSLLCKPLSKLDIPMLCRGSTYE